MESAWPSSSQQLLHPQSVGRAIDDGKRNEIAAAAATAAAVSPASSLTVSCGSGGSQNFEDAFRARAPHHHLDAVMSISAGNNGAAPSSSSAVVLPTGEEVDLASTVSGDVTSSEEESSLRGPSPPDIDDIVAQSMLNRDAIPISELLGDDDEEDDDDDQDDEDDDESVASSSGFVSRPSPLLLPNTSVGSDANPCPRPVADARLEMALDGQEPNVRNLIMAAIGVMKNRKARPDTKRICNWIHRRYGRPYMSISEELERLVMAGELARVDYKGSVSFRINSPGGRVTKRRKKLGQGLLSLVAKPTNQEAESGNGTTASPIISSTPPSILSDGVSLQVNLRTLVSDLVKHTDGFAHNNSSGVTITTKFISKAVESAKHNINRPFILANLEQILAKEVEAGHFVKVGPGTYTVQPLPSQRSILQPQFPQQPIPQQLQPMEPVAKHEMPMPAESLLRRPPSAFLAVSHKSEEERKNDLIQEKLSKLTSASFKDKEPRNKSPSKKVSSINKEPFYVTLREKRLAGLSRKHASSSSVASKNKDSGFNGSLAMKLQAESKEDAEKNALALPLLRAVTKGMGVGKLKGRAKRLREAKLKELQMMVAASSRVETAAARKEGGGQRRKKREEWQMRQDHGDGIAVEGFSPGGRPGSKREKVQKYNVIPLESDALARSHSHTMARPCREKKSRKIFDPADHDQPSRKRKISSVSPTPPPHPTGLVSAAPLTVAAGDAFAQQAKQVPAATVVFNGVGQGSIEANGEEVCMYCRAPGGRNFNGKPEILLSCRDCTTKVHPNCMDYTAELTKKILTTEWQCTNCKTCAVCEEANPSEDEQMLFCDSCDLGYHMSCHRPPVWAKPVGNWECFKCNPLQPPSMPPPISNKTRTRTHSHENSSSTRTISNGHKGETMDEQTSKFLPILPPHLHPHTGLLPKNWEDYPQDPTIPDVADWEASQISTYFANQGFPTEQAGIFVKEEIDGKSLLLLHRQDVLTGLGLKLGPALKLFNHVKKLQTRRNFPNI